MHINYSGYEHTVNSLKKMFTNLLKQLSPNCIRYGNFTQNFLTCNLINSVVGPLNTTILVDSQYGRSVAARDLYYVTPNEQIYTYEAYAGRVEKTVLVIRIANQDLKLSILILIWLRPKIIIQISIESKNNIFKTFSRNIKFEHKHRKCFRRNFADHTGPILVYGRKGTR